MKRSIAVVAILAAVFALLLAPGAHATLTPEQTKDAQALIAQFGAVDFQTRQAAVDKLVAMGPDVAPLVRKALGEATDAEVKLRCQMVFKGLGRDYGYVVDASKPGAPVIVNFSPSLVTLNVRDMAAKDVLDLISTQSGNRPMLIAPNLRARTVTLSLANVTYWEAVDRLCDAAGLVLLPDSVQNRLMLQEREGDSDVGGYAGPVAVKLDSGTVTRRLRAMKVPLSHERSAATLTYYATFAWEDRLPVQSVSFRVTQALMSDGKNLLEGVTAVSSQVVTTARMRNYGTAYLSFTGIPQDMRRFSEISGTVSVACRLDEQTLKMENVFAGAPKPVTSGGCTLTLNDSSRKKSYVTMDLLLRREWEEPPGPSKSDPTLYVFSLVDPKGDAHPASVSSRPASKKTTVKKPAAREELSEEWEMTVRFVNLPELDGPWTLLMSWPDRIDTRDYPMSIKDVPVP